MVQCGGKTEKHNSTTDSDGTMEHNNDTIGNIDGSITWLWHNINGAVGDCDNTLKHADGIKGHICGNSQQGSYK